jgi:hypothetical protein
LPGQGNSGLQFENPNCQIDRKQQFAGKQYNLFNSQTSEKTKDKSKKTKVEAKRRPGAKHGG